MAKKLPDLVRRQRALEKTKAAFANREFELGSADCAKLVYRHLRAMGHKKLPSIGNYKGISGARAQLKKVAKAVKAKKESLEAILDAVLPRIAPASMLPGDIAIVEMEDGPLAVGGGALVVMVGTKFWGWHPDAPTFAVIEPNGMPFRAAWRA